MKKAWVTVLGFLIFSLGFLSIILTLVGLNFQIFGWMYSIGRGFAFLAYIIMIMAGGIIMYLSKLKD